MTESVSPAVALLNRAFAADPTAVSQLMAFEVPCTQALCDASIMAIPDPITPRGTVCALGLVNEVLAAYGLPPVAAMYSTREPHELQGFCNYNPSPADAVRGIKADMLEVMLASPQAEAAAAEISKYTREQILANSPSFPTLIGTPKAPVETEHDAE